MTQKVGRNDPCPCGSGKKYKKCCEEKAQKKQFQAQVLTGSTDKLSSFFKRSMTPVPPSEPGAEKKNDVM
jgi:hypothetical protein